MRPLRICFVTPYAPSRLRPRPFHIIRALAERGHRVTLFSAAATDRDLADLRALEPHCERVHGVRIPLARSLWSCARGLAVAAPLQAYYCFSPYLAAAIRHALAPTGAYDVLHVEHLRAALYGGEASDLPRVYDAVDCMSRLLAQTAAGGPTWSSRLTARIELPRTRPFERALTARFDRILLTTEPERAALLALAAASAENAARIHVLPNGVDLDYFKPSATPRDAATLVFVGRMAYHANVAAARQLLTQVMPRIWTRRPDARLLVVGANPPAAVRRLAKRAVTRVEVTGSVRDVRPYLMRATVSVSPLPYAVGIQNKVLEAMAAATPVVATHAACSALRAVPGEHLLMADDPDAFAAAVLRLLDDTALARTLGAAGRRYVEAQHDWRAAARDLEAVYHDAIAAHASADAPHAAAGVA
jgi:sugar transferase (PEP-CTERM/EpsH1 system associated)